MLALLIAAIWALLHHQNLGYDAVGMSYEAVVERRELWRCAASQLSHVDLLHIGGRAVEGLYSDCCVIRAAPRRPRRSAARAPLSHARIKTNALCSLQHRLTVVFGHR